MLEAFQVYEDSLCSGCGQSTFHSLDPMNTLQYDAASVECVACSTRETYIENHSDRLPGEKIYIENTMGEKAGR